MEHGAGIVITDSGLGGLSVCAGLERMLRDAGVTRDVRLTYVNAWPFEGRGYNDLPDVSARARVFDLALARMASMRPDRILIACNTLSVLYPHTAFSRRQAVVVQGIVEAGTALFAERLQEDPVSTIILIGTKTTIESGVHRDELIRRGIAPSRMSAAACHGLAAAIERDVDGPRTTELIETCMTRAAEGVPPGSTVYLGLCCTHYGYVAVRLADVVARRTSRRVRTLDPNVRMVSGVLSEDGAGTAPGSQRAERRGSVSVEVISKVTLTETARSGIARLVSPVSPETAAALLSYAHVPDLF